LGEGEGGGEGKEGDVNEGEAEETFVFAVLGESEFPLQ
jgi:hypothetical protein